MGDQDLRVNQKFQELIQEGIVLNPMADPREVVRVCWDSLVVWGKTQGISVSLPQGLDAQRWFQSVADTVYTGQINQHCNRQLREFIAQNMSPTGPKSAKASGMGAREAVRKACDDLVNWMRSQGYPANALQIGEKEFELLVEQAEKAVNTYRENQEKGAVPLGQHGVYMDTLSDEEYQERMKRLGLG
jgi:hypothetical protein